MGGLLDSGGASSDVSVACSRGGFRRKRGPKIDRLRRIWSISGPVFRRRPSRKRATATSENAPAADRALARDLVRLGTLLPAGYPSPVPPVTFRLPPAARFWLRAHFLPLPPFRC